MTLRELRAKKRISQTEAAEMAAEGIRRMGKGYSMNQVKWSILEALDDGLVETLEEIFGVKIDIPAGDGDD